MTQITAPLPIPWLSILIFTPLIASVLAYIIGRYSLTAMKIFSLGVALFTLELSLLLYNAYAASGVSGFAAYRPFSELKVPWAPAFGLYYSVAIDGINLPLVLVSTLLTTLVVAGSWRLIHHQVREFYALILIFESAIIGVFTSLNLILFYVFWELVLIPMFFLIGIWGGPRRKYAAMKFLIYTHVGSVIMLVGFVAMGLTAAPNITFEFLDLPRNLPVLTQLLLTVLIFFGFAVKLPVVPFHTWLPDAHVEAPAPVSVFLAGLLLKMGGYGFIRFNLTLFPDATRTLAPAMIGLALFTMFYGAFVAMIQQDLKRMIALTSINHMGYVLLGAYTLNIYGATGAVFQMFNHACAIGCLFLLSGVIDHWSGSRVINKLMGMGQKMPRVSFVLVMGSLAAMGVPGFANFISEFMVIWGAIWYNNTFTPYLAVAVLVPGVTAAYFLWMIRRTMFAKSEPLLEMRDAPKDVILTLTLFLVPLIVLGVYPAPMLQVVDATVRSLPIWLRA